MFALLAQLVSALIIGHTTPTTCGPLPAPGGGSYAGWYDEANDRIVIADYVCAYTLLDPAASKINLLQFSYAVFVVAHEGAHASGVVDEHLADCLAVKKLPAVVKGLGLRSNVAAKVKTTAIRYASKGKCPRGSA